MSSNGEHDQDPVFTTKEDIELRIDETNRLKAESRRQRFRRRVTTASLIILVGLVLFIAGYFWLGGRPPAQVPPSSRHELVFTEVSESVFNYGTLRETQVTLPDDAKFAVQIYDFDDYYYPQGAERVTKEAEFLSVLGKHQKDFVKAWVVIFAGASFEGATKRNLDLCRCRVWNVGMLMSSRGTNDSLAYWSMPVGEFRLANSSTRFVEDGPEVEAEEEEQAKKLGEDGLKSQRRLIVVAVRPPSHLEDDKRQAKLDEVIEALDGKGLLPTNYDKGRAKPTPMDLTDEHNDPCKTTTISIIFKRN